MAQKNSSQPNDCDAVLGGVTPTPVDAAVLGGLHTKDTESTMGFYSIDGYWSVWSSDSFFGPEMVKHFLDRIVDS